MGVNLPVAGPKLVTDARNVDHGWRMALGAGLPAMGVRVRIRVGASTRPTKSADTHIIAA